MRLFWTPQTDAMNQADTQILKINKRLLSMHIDSSREKRADFRILAETLRNVGHKGFVDRIKTNYFNSLP